MRDDVHALSGAYALDALPEDECAAFEAHLELCADCQREVREFHDVAAGLAVLVEEPPPAGLREQVLAMVAEGPAADAVQAATVQLLAARAPEEVVDVLATVVDQLGGWTVPADLADDRALPLDIALGRGAPVLPAAEPGSQAHDDLQRHLPGLVEDAREALESIRRSQGRDGGRVPTREREDPGP